MVSGLLFHEPHGGGFQGYRDIIGFEQGDSYDFEGNF